MRSLEFSRRAKRRGVTPARPRAAGSNAQLGLGVALRGADRHHRDAGAGLHHRRHRVEAAHAYTVVRHAPGTPRLLRLRLSGCGLASR